MTVHLRKDPHANCTSATRHLTKRRRRNEDTEPLVVRGGHDDGFEASQVGFLPSSPIAYSLVPAFVPTSLVEREQRIICFSNDAPGQSIVAAQLTQRKGTSTMYHYAILSVVYLKSRTIACSISPIVVAWTKVGPADIHCAGPPQSPCGPPCSENANRLNGAQMIVLFP